MCVYDRIGSSNCGRKEKTESGTLCISETNATSLCVYRYIFEVIGNDIRRTWSGLSIMLYICYRKAIWFMWNYHSFVELWWIIVCKLLENLQVEFINISFKNSRLSDESSDDITFNFLYVCCLCRYICKWVSVIKLSNTTWSKKDSKRCRINELWRRRTKELKN